MEVFSLDSSVWCCASISLWRARLFCFRAEVLRADSDSRRRESWDIRFDRFSRRVVICDSVRDSSSVGFGGRVVLVAYWE